jgi:hypothetical protein
MCVRSVPWVHDTVCVTLSLEHKGEGLSEALQMKESCHIWGHLGSTVGPQYLHMQAM